MNTGRARQCYLSALFVLLLTNVFSATLAAIGIHGFAFYHLQAVLLFVLMAQACVLLLDGGMRPVIDRSLFRWLLLSLLYSAVSAVFLLRFSDVVPAYVLLIVHTVSF